MFLYIISLLDPYIISYLIANVFPYLLKYYHAYFKFLIIFSNTFASNICFIQFVVFSGEWGTYSWTPRVSRCFFGLWARISSMGISNSLSLGKRLGASL